MVTTNVASFRPYDVTQFKSRDAAAAVLLAYSLGWRVLPRENGPVALVAGDGKQIRVPDNTGIKMDVFRGWIHQIAVHSPDLSIDRKLIDEIVHQTKLNREHARLMYELVEEATSQPEPEPEPDVGMASTPGFGEPYLLSMEPWVDFKGRVSDFAMTRQWSNETVDYVCVHCLDHNVDPPVSSPNIKGITAHQQWHIRRGQVPGKTIKTKIGSRRRTYIPPEETKPVTKTGEKARTLAGAHPSANRALAQMDQEVAVAALDALRKLEQIRELLGPGNEDEMQALRDVIAKRDDRIAQLEGNLKALRDLLAGDL